MYVHSIQYVHIYVSTLFTGYLIVCKCVSRSTDKAKACAFGDRRFLQFFIEHTHWGYTCMHKHVREFERVCMCGVYLCPCILQSTQFVSRVLQFRFDLNKQPLQLGGNSALALPANKQQQNGVKGSNKIKQTFKFLCLAFFVGFFLFFSFFSAAF